MNAELEKKISDLKRETEVKIMSAEFEHEIKMMFPSIEIMAYIRDWNGLKRTANFEVKTKEEFQEVFNKFKATDLETVIGFAGKENTTIESPYKIDLNNPCQTGRFSSFEMQISYKSEDIDIRIKLPTFNSGDSISWYGGDKTLKTVEKIDKIIEFLLK